MRKSKRMSGSKRPREHSAVEEHDKFVQNLSEDLEFLTNSIQKGERQVKWELDYFIGDEVFMCEFELDWKRRQIIIDVIGFAGSSGTHRALVFASRSAAPPLHRGYLRTTLTMLENWGRNNGFRYIFMKDVIGSRLLSVLDSLPWWTNTGESGNFGPHYVMKIKRVDRRAVHK